MCTDALTSYEYKKKFLPFIDSKILFNDDKIQVYRIQNYLKGILPVNDTYKISFGYLILVTKGFIVQQLEERQYTIRESQCINIHKESNTRTLDISDDAEGYVIVYEMDISTCSFSNSNSRPPYYKLKESDVLPFKISLELLESELMKTKGNFMVTLNIFNSIVYRLIDYQAYELVNIRDVMVTNDFKKLVEKNLFSQRTVCFYAEALNISQSYLNKILKRTIRKSAKQYIKEFCIDYSKLLLQNFSKNIAEIAYELNFESASYFTRLFKRVNSITPKEYREKLQIGILKKKEPLICFSLN